ncbi:hypothetical protein HPB51_004401 [Rhipicephalus microplus]|uniref:Uncharacterized protein n=1 Tax=Rhipicephalus microplus TaxID=6941 RepID=A0A9J6EM84_RHIMP|nr:hypothetical protein HPB51_004401 [Rhipicephalus microplus]
MGFESEKAISEPATGGSSMAECFECDGLTKGGGAYRDNWAVTDRGTRGSVMSRRPLEPLSGAMMIRTRQRLAERPSEGYDPGLIGNRRDSVDQRLLALSEETRKKKKKQTLERCILHTRASPVPLFRVDASDGRQGPAHLEHSATSSLNAVALRRAVMIGFRQRPYGASSHDCEGPSLGAKAVGDATEWSLYAIGPILPTPPLCLHNVPVSAKSVQHPTLYSKSQPSSRRASLPDLSGSSEKIQDRSATEAATVLYCTAAIRLVA